MADSEEQRVSSSSPHYYDEGSNLLGTGAFSEAMAAKDVLLDDIVDLVGGAQDAIERHIAEDGGWQVESPPTPPPVPTGPVTEPIRVTELEEALTPSPEPLTTLASEAAPVEEEFEPEEPVVVVPPVEEEEAVPDSTTAAEPEPEPPALLLAPKAEPESYTPEPEPEPEPEPIQQHVDVVSAPVVVEPPREEEEEVVVVEEEAPPPPPSAPPAAAEPLPQEEPAPVVTRAASEPVPAPAAHEHSPSNSQTHPLMQFPTALGQKGDSPAPISPLSPLHSPDSLEELSLTESPNQPPTSASAALYCSSSSSTKPPQTRSKDMPWDREEGHSGTGHSKNQEDDVDPLAGPYLSLGKDPVHKNLCEDSGVSFSPEDKALSSGSQSTGGPSPLSPQVLAFPESHPASSNPTEPWDSTRLASQDNSRVSMDTFSKDTTPIGSSRYEPDMHGKQSDEDDDDLMHEVKKSSHPFQGFSPVADAGYSHFGDDSKASKMSESPTPDLVQYGQTGDSQDTLPSFLDEGKAAFESAKMTTTDSLMSQFSGLKEDEDDDDEDSALPPSLPDILKSSPLNPEKMDSGSSTEGTPEEQSPVLERRMMESPNPPINLSANNPFAFDSKVSLLKEMAEETEARISEKTFGAFDLVKEAEETTPTKAKEEEHVKIEQKDWFSCHDSPKMADTFKPLDFQTQKPPATGDDSDSDVPTADSLSPVLEAMIKNPAIFQVETDEQKAELKMEVEEDFAEEVSEPEISSEEFEFIERPPRGIIDEFLEALDNSKFPSSSKAPELLDDDDLIFGKTEPSAPAELEEESPSQSSYLLLTQASPKSSPQKGKAELEKPEVPQAPAPSQAPLIHTPVSKPEETIANESTAGCTMFQMPNLSAYKVVDLLYWRDLKTTGVVFGAALLLLLSLTACSIVSVSSYIGLALLSVTVTFRIYKGVLQAIQKSDDGHPFKQYLDLDVALSDDLVHKYGDAGLDKFNKLVLELRRLFLVEDLVDSIKFAVLMWILTYIGALFNGLTLIILVLVGAFSLPVVYEKHQVQIDHYLGMVNNQIKDIVGKVQDKVPGLKRKAE